MLHLFLFFHQLAEQHYLIAIVLYMLLYALLVIFSLPIGTIFTLLAGCLFSLWPGVLFALLSSTIGGTVFVVTSQTIFKTWIANKPKPWVYQLENKFRHHAFSYLLSLRLIPVMPYWVVNMAAVYFNIPLRQYIPSTFLGAIPINIVYVSLGSSLGEVLLRNEVPTLNAIWEPKIFFTLLGIALLSILPIIIKRFYRNTFYI